MQELLIFTRFLHYCKGLIPRLRLSVLLAEVILYLIIYQSVIKIKSAGFGNVCQKPSDNGGACRNSAEIPVYLPYKYYTMIDKPNNPYINTIPVPYTEYINHITIVDNVPRIGNTYNIEDIKYIRMYKTKELREMLYKQLSMYARDMFMAIQYFTNDSYTYVILSYEKMNELYGTNMSRRRYDDTVKELIRFNIIDCKDKRKHEYWYNFRYFSPNNRVSLFPEASVKIRTVYNNI